MLFRSRAIPLTFWFLWTSLAFFRCSRLHPIITVRSELLPSHPQSLQLLDLIVLLIQLPKQRHRVTEQPISSKTQPKTARNHLTRTSMHQLKFLPHEHALPRASTRCHVPPLAATRLYVLSVSLTCLTRKDTRPLGTPTHLLRLTYCHVSPTVTSHCHVSTHQPLTLT